EVTGEMFWVRPGFSNQFTIMGSRYTPPADGERGIMITNGRARMAGTNLAFAGGFFHRTTNLLSVTDDNEFHINPRFTGATYNGHPLSNYLALTLNTNLGTVTGSTYPYGRKINAVYLPFQNVVGGYYIGTKLADKGLAGYFQVEPY
ncbi:MAG: hypothetical protein RL380_632, partial [Verrucomicrobiota bacterium]